MGRPGGKKPLIGLGLYYILIKWTLRIGYLDADWIHADQGKV
jgi:hypothetical protein